MEKTVYVVKIPGDLYKIGITKNLGQRLKSLSTSIPFDLEPVHTIRSEYAPQIERALHQELRKFRVKGEWYKLSDAQIEYVKTYTYDPKPKAKKAIISKKAIIANVGNLNPKQHMTLAEVHGFFPEIGRSTLNEWARTGKIEAHRSGKVWITTRAAIEAAIRNQGE